MTRLVTIELKEYNDLLNIKECHEKNVELLRGHVAIPEEKYDYFVELEQRIGKAIEFIEHAEHGDEYSNFVVPIGEDNGCPEEACEELIKILKGEDNNE